MAKIRVLDSGPAAGNVPGMLTLVLLRHAKSSWADGSLDDYDRPLAKRGLKAAPEVGAALAALGVRPELILCSGAARTRQTLDLVLPHLEGVREIVYDDAIYLATPAALLSLLRRLGDDGRPMPRTVMIVGHNPGLEELATLLVDGGAEEARRRMAVKFPTGAVSIIGFDAETWPDVALAEGRLQNFLTPKQLT